MADVNSQTEDSIDGPVILFDGVCNLCNGAVQWVIERDGAGVFRFASLQSEIGQTLVQEYDNPTEDLDSVVLIADGDCYTKSRAALGVLKRLGVPYSLLYPFVFVPRVVRDRVYDFVADNRYDWFGKRDSCMVPDPELEDRFLE